ncbi:bile acid:sodium symporter [Paracoccus mutanolyticus]|uniref:bile acid:sodium symporter n=1 Tax=Paracoccus mutanolyticus TaxID=1499308 RepID=UPI0021D52B7A|nr:bile acid:sodium symporter [Paracoccus mutanolyticus]
MWSQIPVPAMVLSLLAVSVFLALAMAIMAGTGRLMRMPQADQAVLFFCGSTKSLASSGISQRDRYPRPSFRPAPRW